MKNLPRDAVSLFESYSLAEGWPTSPRTPRSTSLVENRRAAGSEDKSPMAMSMDDFVAFFTDQPSKSDEAEHARFLEALTGPHPDEASQRVFLDAILDLNPGEPRRSSLVEARRK